MISKINRKNPKYLKWIRTLTCVVCEKEKKAFIKAEPHHEAFGTGGTGLKGPDTWTIPLCREHHNERETTWLKKFWDKYLIDPKLMIMALQNRFMSKH